MKIAYSEFISNLEKARKKNMDVMNVSGIKWLNYETPKPQIEKKPKALGKGFDEVLKAEMAAIREPRKGVSMKYRVINHENAMKLIFDESEVNNLFLIGYTYEGQLALYPVKDLSMQVIDRDINSESEFLYTGTCVL